MIVSAIDRPQLVESIPDPATIRQRLDELRAEARILRELLPVAERRQRQALRHTQQREGTRDE
ncbi:MAG: hypothetical protein GX575_25725 [Candidatus Anammoximicrobium sp.]|nr:hypothetical protein [Candidatus Anammoximicrobium sp.]